MPDGESVAVRRLLFHAARVKGYKVIAWTDAGLAYALVSDLDGRGQQSCLVCHHGREDRDFPELLAKQPAAGF